MRQNKIVNCSVYRRMVDIIHKFTQKNKYNFKYHIIILQMA